MSLDFVAIDFETANNNPASICQIGAVKFRDGEPVDSFASLVKPHERLNLFEYEKHTELHHITKSDILEAPEWPEVLGRFESYFVEDLPLVAHRAANADAKMMREDCILYRMPMLENGWIDTWALAKELLPNLPNHRYKTICKHFGIDMGSYHQAVDDANGAGQIPLKLAQSAHADDFEALEYAWNDAKYNVSGRFPDDLVSYAKSHERDTPNKWLEGMRPTVKKGDACVRCGKEIGDDASYTARKSGMCGTQCKAEALKQAKDLASVIKNFRPISTHYSIYS